MTGLPILLSRRKSSFISLDSQCDALRDYLRSTTRAIDALFSKNGLSNLGSGAYSYQARPIKMVFWDVLPFLVFHIEQPSSDPDHPADLRLVLDSCQLSGDEKWSVVAANLVFDCHAAFSARPSGVLADASAAATIILPRWLRMIPDALAKELATPVVDYVLDRLLVRFEKSVAKDMNYWIMSKASMPSFR